MDPDRIVFTSTVTLVSLKALIWLIPGVNLSDGAVVATVIFTFGFHIGMMTIADSLTGQKTIRVIRSYGGVERINRDDRLDYFLAMAGGVFWVFLGIIFVLFFW